MLYSGIIAFSSRLSEYLRYSFRLNEDIVSLHPLLNPGSMTPENKVYVSLVNIERDTTAGLQFVNQHVSGNSYKRGAPAWQLNVYVVIAAVFKEKQYEDSLSVLSGITSFLQSNNQFVIPQTDHVLIVEPVNVSFHELSNLWGILGGTYYPSIVCKLRNLSINSDEIKGISIGIKQENLEI